MGIIKDYFGKNLKRLRTVKGMTQEQLAEAAGINQRQITRIETCKSFPSLDTLDKICEALNVPPSSLFDFDYIMSGNKTLSTENQTFEELFTRRIKQVASHPRKLKFLELALKSLDGDKTALQKMQLTIDGMLLLEE